MTELNRVRIPLRRLDADVEVPAYALEGDAGADLRATEDVVLAPGERALVGTGIAIALPLGYAGFVHPRSGLAVRHGVTVLNAPGTIDAGYRGEIKVPLINLDPTTTVTLRRGDRIAQLVVQAVVHGEFEIVDALEDSARGAAGFGSTGGVSPTAPSPQTPHASAESAPTPDESTEGRVTA
ncbi:MAG: dUTP diphosphatase [Micrococcus sp.]|nr:dUTP diphosphatase [Micrococcus sp.]